MNKPTKPNITIPESFAANGVKADFDNNKILNGFDRIQPDVLAGDNLNKFIDDTYKGLNYGIKGVDYLEERWKSQLTNCLLEVPQRIKLELADGVLTLKAGSEVIVPNGFEEDGKTPKFDYVKNEEDKICKGFVAGKCSILINTNNELYSTTQEQCHASGTTEPSGFIGIFYNTTLNKVGYRSDATKPFAYGYALPLGWATNISTTECSSIDQVFNGMGYIGTHFWLDKDVKMLLADGRNKDGTLKNKEVVIDNVVVSSAYDSTSGYRYNAYYNNQKTINNIFTKAVFYGLKKDMPNDTPQYSRWYYATDENNWYYAITGSNSWNKTQLLILNSYKWDRDNQFVSEYKQERYAFRAVDYSDKSEVSGWAMPSNKYIDLEVGAHGSEYTAPANGYFSIKGTTLSASLAQVALWKPDGVGFDARSFSFSAGTDPCVILPAKKGDIVGISIYNVKDVILKFFYAEGEV